jgi:AcrR family transcriptional regulator
MSTDHLDKKIELSLAAVTLYEKNGGNFTVAELSAETGIEQNTIYELFPGKKSILKYYYNTIVLRYRFMIEEIDGFKEFSISEKLSNFMFTSFDLLNEHPAFVKETFYDYQCKAFKTSSFEKEVDELFKTFFEEDPNISISAAVFTGSSFYALLRQKYLAIVLFWLHDDSEHKDKTFALVDKLNSFVEEVMYNKVIDKGFDLLKFSLTSSGMFSDLPFVNNPFNSSSKDEEE